MLSRVDHLVYSTPDLAGGVEEIERQLGVRATSGGVHPGRGTRNALLALGSAAYLEIIAPDPGQPAPQSPRAFGLDHLRESKLVAWCVRAEDFDATTRDAARKGIPLGDVTSGSRRRSDGTFLSWRFTDPGTVLGDGIVPFFIDWGASPHPASLAATGASLVDLRAAHPDPERVRRMLRDLGVDLPVDAGPSPVLLALVDCPRGRVALR